AKGVNGTLSFDGRMVTISRKGAMARTTVGTGEKRIPVHSITAVRWKAPSHLVRGFIAFTIAGGIENQKGFGRQTVDAARDVNAVVIKLSQAQAFEALRDEIEAALATS
ncbi:MAG: DUF4429 domain-containing protein, partial [Acidimicrobiales bacterium]